MDKRTIVELQGLQAKMESLGCWFLAEKIGKMLLEVATESTKEGKGPAAERECLDS